MPTRQSTYSSARRGPGRPKAPPEEIARRRRQIAVAAYEEFADRGYRAVGVADIARRLGTGHSTIYHYFSNKRAILDEVLDYVVEHFSVFASGTELEQADTFDDWARALRNAALRATAEFDDKPAMLRFALFEAGSVDEELTRRVLGLLAVFRAVIAGALEQAMKRGLVRQDLDVEATARAIHGVVLNGMLGLLEPDFDVAARNRYADAALAILSDGLRR